VEEKKEKKEPNTLHVNPPHQNVKLQVKVKHGVKNQQNPKINRTDNRFSHIYQYTKNLTK